MRERLGSAVTDLVFDRATMLVPALSVQHQRMTIERTAGPVLKLVETLSTADPGKLAAFRREFEALAAEYFDENLLRQDYLLTHATKVGESVRIRDMAAASARAYVPPPDDDPSPGGTMAFLEHLDELRKRIIRSCLAIAVGAVIAFAFIERIVTFVLAPARKSLPPGAVLIYTNPGEAFSLYMQVAVMAGVVFASPFVMFQVWRFIAPALYSREKRFAIPFVVLSSGGLVGGAFFSHYTSSSPP